jgi:valyl-tRNA synthetase
MSPSVNPKEYEQKWRDFWDKGGFFKASADSKLKPFTILMPPPNVTAQLHMGHGTSYSVQDILVRWKRMQGYNALWLPGTDHAGIATQMMVEKSLEQEGLTRKGLGREAFEKRLHDWKDKYGGLITQQLRAMGFSCDWDREAYTMDPGLSKAVRAIFVQLFEEGLIYRGERLVNWDTALKTAISDDEIESIEMNALLYFYRYPVEGSEEFIPIATTRPETMLGDTAVAVSPDDERYQHLIGKSVRLPFVDRLIPIVADSYVKAEFGTGAVKITPAHDPNDFEIGKRHSLPMITIMNEDGTMAANVPERFRGLDRFVCRKEVIKALKELNLYDKDESHRNAVPHSERSKTVIEPRLSMQWYVRMKSLAEPAVEVAKNGELKFYPDLWKKTYLHWLENIQDWCISRQLWWGHRIPIWYCGDCSGVTTGMEDPTKCSKCGSTKLKQDEDVLDTWFSSWLWPISPFGWPNETKDLKYFYPTDVLVTASEIIFLWVARMVMVGLKTQGKVPFKDVYIAATVCDKQGRKFSKTLGNGIDPFDVIEAHGTDAVRFTGIHIAPLGGRIKMDAGDFEHGGRFVNKLWNAARFLLRYVEPNAQIQPIDKSRLDMASAWILEEFAVQVEKANNQMEQYRINEAVETMYHFVWGSFCDWALECAKENLNDPASRPQTVSVLVYVLDGALRLLSPIIPFVTEEIWHRLPAHPDWDRPESLVIAAYPDVKKLKHRFENVAATWSTIQKLVVEIRSVRALAEINPKDQLAVIVKTSDTELGKNIESSAGLIRRLANLSSLTLSSERQPQSLVAIGPGFEAYIPAEGVINIDKERKRLEQEKTRVSKVIAGIQAKLSNPNFVDRAPEDVIVTTKAQFENMTSQLKSLEQNLASLG